MAFSKFNYLFAFVFLINFINCLKLVDRYGAVAQRLGALQSRHTVAESLIIPINKKRHRYLAQLSIAIGEASTDPAVKAGFRYTKNRTTVSSDFHYMYSINLLEMYGIKHIRLHRLVSDSNRNNDIDLFARPRLPRSSGHSRTVAVFI